MPGEACCHWLVSAASTSRPPANAPNRGASLTESQLCGSCSVDDYVHSAYIPALRNMRVNRISLAATPRERWALTMASERACGIVRVSSVGVAALTITLSPGFAGCSRSSDDATNSQAGSSVEEAGPAGTTTVGSSETPPEQPDPCGESGGAPTGETLFEPPDLPNVSLDGENGTLILFSSTLKSGPAGLELYAGICNRGEYPMCSPALQVEFFDHADQLIGTSSGAVQSGRVFRFSQSAQPVTCVAPGQTAMAALTNLPEGLAIADLKSIGHRFPAFRVEDAEPIEGTTIQQLEAFEVDGGFAFRGTVNNDSDSPVTDPVVSVFPLDHVGRPLGNAVGTATVQVPAGGQWAFETNAVVERGDTQLAFAAAVFPAEP